jgi:hypothetical protein
MSATGGEKVSVQACLSEVLRLTGKEKEYRMMIANLLQSLSSESQNRGKLIVRARASLFSIVAHIRQRKVKFTKFRRHVCGPVTPMMWHKTHNLQDDGRSKSMVRPCFDSWMFPGLLIPKLEKLSLIVCLWLLVGGMHDE